jgi:hypothetical protein
MLPSGSGDHFCSPLVARLWKWLFTVLVYWDFHTGVLFLAPFSGPGSMFYQLPLLSMCYDGLLFVFQFCEAVWLWMLLTGSRDEIYDLLPALLQGVAYHSPNVQLPAFPVFVY